MVISAIGRPPEEDRTRRDDRVGVPSDIFPAELTEWTAVDSSSSEPEQLVASPALTIVPAMDGGPFERPNQGTAPAVRPAYSTSCSSGRRSCAGRPA